MKAEEKRQAARGKTRKKKRKPLRRERLCTADKLALAQREENVFPKGLDPQQCRFSHSRPVWRLENGRAVLVAYHVFRGGRNPFGKIPGALGRSEFGIEIVIAIAYVAELDDELLERCAARWLDETPTPGVVFFKFDGMGGGNETTGARAEMADDVDAVLELTRTLRRENPDLFISATVGTWASPFWTFYVDSIWRQGGDTGFYGKGDTRQQWITYRDMYCHDRIVQSGPLYPLNSLMLLGPCISDRRNASRMARNEKSVADEIWSFFGSGTNLQELYITPHVLTSTMWDKLAAAGKWSRANSEVLVDTHWIGGSPGKDEVYGWASWQPRKGIVTLRNPSEKSQTFARTLADALELPKTHLTSFVLKVVRGNRGLGTENRGRREPLFENTDDSDYKTMLRAIQQGRCKMPAHPRVDMET